MKNLLSILFLIALLAFTSCKKGDNDPFFSFYTRQARMHGDWTLAQFEYEERTSNPDGDYTEVTEDYEDGVITKISVQYFDQNGTSVIDSSWIYVEHVKYNFNKNGTWTKELTTVERLGNCNEIGGGEISCDTLVTTITLIESGDWSFMGEVPDEFKNKERIIMNVLSQSTSSQQVSKITMITPSDTMYYQTVGDKVDEINHFSSGEISTIWEIDQLKKKEIVFIEKRRNSGTVTITPYQGNPTTSDEDSFRSDSRLVLTRIQ